ncbi:response regulator [Sphingobium algorifonticola]|uniref:response regulator n=1 Tax=Sphingobium algorifonticola TaxID=2008318 RepID=UPI00240792D7|nr:response regulator [Sphingobium algorifonticola]
MEDESMIAMLLEDIITDLGCIVVACVATVADALASIEGDQLDAALLDVNLGSEQSYGIADVLGPRAVPYLFISGYGDRGIDPRYQGRPVLQKPFTADSIEQALSGILG